MKDLLIGCVGGRSNLDLSSRSNILHVAKDYIGSFAIIVGILTAPDGTNVGRDACVNDDVLFTSVTIDV